MSNVIPFPARQPRRLPRAALRLIADAAVRDLGLDRATAEAIAFAPPAYDWRRQHNEHVVDLTGWRLLQALTGG